MFQRMNDFVNIIIQIPPIKSSKLCINMIIEAHNVGFEISGLHVS